MNEDGGRHSHDGYAQTFRERGYVAGIPIFLNDEVDRINRDLEHILALLEPGESTKEIREWHEESRFLYDLCMEDRILDCVEPLLGPDFFMWASNFFIIEKMVHMFSTLCILLKLILSIQIGSIFVLCVLAKKE